MGTLKENVAAARAIEPRSCALRVESYIGVARCHLGGLHPWPRKGDDMFRRATAFLIAASAALVLEAGPARADAPPNENNCAGAFVSELTPAFTATAPPSCGESRRELARAGLTGETEKAATEALASCGTP